MKRTSGTTMTRAETQDGRVRRPARAAGVVSPARDHGPETTRPAPVRPALITVLSDALRRVGTARRTGAHTLVPLLRTSRSHRRVRCVRGPPGDLTARTAEIREAALESTRQHMTVEPLKPPRDVDPRGSAERDGHAARAGAGAAGARRNTHRRRILPAPGQVTSRNRGVTGIRRDGTPSRRRPGDACRGGGGSGPGRYNG